MIKKYLNIKAGTKLYVPVRNIAVLIVLGIIAAGCGANKPYYKNAAADTSLPYSTFDDQEPSFSLFLIGDAGSGVRNATESNMRALHHQAIQAGEKSAIIFLGDNIYNRGLHPPDHPERAKEEKKMNVQMDVEKGYDGQVIFVPGNHDWNDDKPDGLSFVNRQQEYVENRLGDEGYAPDEGCPGPVEYSLDSQNTLLVIDTEWWLYPHEKPGPEECRYGTRDQFIAAMDSVVKANRNKNVFVVAHHAMYSNGKHNGYLPVKNHLFPLLKLNPNLYIPLPIIGSIKPLYRRHVGYLQDLQGSEYSLLRDRLIAIFKQHPNLVYASGHDHSLQYHPIDGQHYIVSGGGSKHSYVRKGKNAAFAYSHLGFARVDILKSEVLLSFWTPESEEPEGKLVYQTSLYTY